MVAINDDQRLFGRGFHGWKRIRDRVHWNQPRAFDVAERMLVRFTAIDEQHALAGEGELAAGGEMRGRRGAKRVGVETGLAADMAGNAAAFAKRERRSYRKPTVKSQKLATPSLFAATPLQCPPAPCSQCGLSDCAEGGCGPPGC